MAQLFAVFLCARLNEFKPGACVFALHIYWCVVFFFHRVFAQSQLRENVTSRSTHLGADSSQAHVVGLGVILWSFDTFRDVAAA